MEIGWLVDPIISYFMAHEIGDDGVNQPPPGDQDQVSGPQVPLLRRAGEMEIPNFAYND